MGLTSLGPRATRKVWLGVLALARSPPPKNIGKAQSKPDQHEVLLGAEIAPEVTGHGLPLSKCEAYNRVYDQPC